MAFWFYIEHWFLIIQRINVISKTPPALICSKSSKCFFHKWVLVWWPLFENVWQHLASKVEASIIMDYGVKWKSRILIDVLTKVGGLPSTSLVLASITLRFYTMVGATLRVIGQLLGFRLLLLVLFLDSNELP